jgi:uncharacterized membrane protein YfcA
MLPDFHVTLAFSFLIGVLLGVMGSGGSILTLPVLVYSARISPQAAVPMSMVIVGAASLVAAYLQARRGHFHSRAAVLFGTSGVVGAYFGSAGTHLVSQTTLMLIFSALLLLVGAVLLWGGARDLSPKVCIPVRCFVAGGCIGLLTGFLGVGGGFLLVPALLLFAGVEAKAAVGTSLAIISLNSAAGLLGQLRYGELNWMLTAALTGLTIAGMIGGIMLGERIGEETLRKAFALLLIAVAVLVGTLNLSAV